MEEQQQTQCPVCGHVYELAYRPIERQILKAVATAQRNEGKARTKAVAVRVYLSTDQTLRYLNSLERRGLVNRIGKKGGWRIAA